jgi:hypothetical protein
MPGAARETMKRHCTGENKAVELMLIHLEVKQNAEVLEQFLTLCSNP